MIIAHNDGLGQFHVRTWDGTTLTSRTEADGANGSRAPSPRIGITSAGVLATAYGANPGYLT